MTSWLNGLMAEGRQGRGGRKTGQRREEDRAEAGGRQERGGRKTGQRQKEDRKEAEGRKKPFLMERSTPVLTTGCAAGSADSIWPPLGALAVDRKANQHPRSQTRCMAWVTSPSRLQRPDLTWRYAQIPVRGRVMSRNRQG